MLQWSNEADAVWSCSLHARCTPASADVIAARDGDISMPTHRACAYWLAFWVPGTPLIVSAPLPVGQTLIHML